MDQKLSIASATLNTDPVYVQAQAPVDNPGMAKEIKNREVLEYVRSWIDEQTTKGASGKRLSKTALADRLGMSAPHLINISNGVSGIGAETEQIFADHISNGSIDQLRKDAVAYCRKAPHEGLGAKLEAGEARIWKAESSKAKLRLPSIPGWVWDRIKKMPLGTSYDDELLVELARSLAAHAERLTTPSGRHKIAKKR